MSKNKKSLHQQIIEDTGAMLGGCATYHDGTAINSKKPYKPKSNFGKWLQDFVNKEVDRVMNEKR